MVLEPLSGLDAKIAAIYVDRLIITTPNASYIPSPPDGESVVFLRADLRYGLDDATLWPQQYSLKYPHLGAILRKPQDLASPFSCFWWTPSPSHFRQSNGTGVSGLGLLVGKEIDELKEHKNVLAFDVRDYLNQKPSTIIAGSLTVMAHSWVRFIDIPGIFEEKCLEVTEFQRNWLELKAALDYEKIYIPRMCNSTSNIVVDDRMGCFTLQPNIAQEFFAAGLPVWWIRPIETVGPNTRIDSIGDMLDGKDNVCLDKRPDHNYPVIYRGPATDDLRYIAQHKFTRSRMVYYNPVNGYRIPEHMMDPDPHLRGIHASSHSESLSNLKTRRTLISKQARSQPCKCSICCCR